MIRILFVDDDAEVLAGLRRALNARQDRWEMRFVDGADAALAALDEAPADVIVSDLDMPGMHGGSLLAEVRRRAPDTARIILSGPPDPADLSAVLGLAHQFLSKPLEPDDLANAIDRAVWLRTELADGRIRAETSGVDVLPSRPGALTELLAVLESPDCEVRAIARRLETDVALTTKLLQLVNSAFFGPRSRITNLEQAIVQLGIPTIRSLILMDSVVRSFDGLGDPRVSHWIDGVSGHALDSARLARLLAPPRRRDDAFCAALLHECGQLVLAACRPELFALHLRLVEDEGASLLELERRAFGVTHAEAGGYLLSLWGLPLDVVKAALAHATAPASPPDVLDLGTLVQIAHTLVEAEGVPVCTLHGAAALDDRWLEQAGLLEAVMTWRSERDLVRAREAREAEAGAPGSLERHESAEAVPA